MQIKLKDNTIVTALKVDGGSLFVQNAQRDVLTIHIAKSAATFAALDAAFGTSAKTERMTIVADDGGEALYEGYIIRLSLSSVPVVITPETGSAPAVTEEHYTVEMAQETYTERLIRELTKK